MDKESNTTISYRITQLEKSIDKLDARVESLLTDQLPKLQLDMVSLKTRINVMSAINISGIIVGIILARFLR